MHAYKNDNGMIDIYLGEPDETITVEEFEARKAENIRQSQIKEHLDALRELGYVFPDANGSEDGDIIPVPAGTPIEEIECNEDSVEAVQTPYRPKRW